MTGRWALAAAALAMGGAIAAPAGPASAQESAQETIDRYQDAGYTVNIDRIGSAPLSQCTVTGVRNPQQTTRLVPNNGQYRWWDDDYDDRLVEVVVRSVSVSLDCSR